MILNLFYRLKSKYVMYKYKKNNTLHGKNTIGKQAVLSETILHPHSRIAAYASVLNSSIGEYTAIGRYTKITHTTIGKYCAISWDCTINALNHSYDALTISAFPYVPYVGNFVTSRTQKYKNVVIQNDVWIGANSVIMPGLTIGNGSVIGAGSVVTKDVPDYAIVAGVPAKVIKHRFSDDTIQTLLLLKWWELDPKIIKENIELFQGKLDDIKLKKLREICK